MASHKCLRTGEQIGRLIAIISASSWCTYAIILLTTNCVPILYMFIPAILVYIGLIVSVLCFKRRQHLEAIQRQLEANQLIETHINNLLMEHEIVLQTTHV